MNKYRRIEADINLDNIRENIKMMKACVPESMKMLPGKNPAFHE